MPDMSDLDKYLSKFEDETNNFELAVVNSDIPDPIFRMIQNLFDGNEVDVVEDKFENIGDNKVVLTKNEDIIAKSPLDSLRDSLLMVNSDLYRTGTVGLDDLQTPDVIKELQNERFDLDGFPESNYEKLMLILISRHIEKLSYKREDAVHRSSFQRLSRIKDESGTEDVYRRLSESDTEVHAYGIPDWEPPEYWDLNIHRDVNREYYDYWFVIHRSDEEDMALLAVHKGDNNWDSVWTTDPEEVKELEQEVK